MNEAPTVRLFGIPRWVVRQWFQKFCYYGMTRFSRNEELRFKGTHSLYLLSGMVIGSRDRRKATKGPREDCQ
jgi:hypothetical protein